MEGSILLNPVPASRPRVTKWGTYYGKRYATWKKAAGLYLPTEPTPYFGKSNVVVCLEFIVKKPITTKRNLPLGDTDNYAKAALDAITSCGAIWEDDDQVSVHVAEKRYALPEEEPQTAYLILEC